MQTQELLVHSLLQLFTELRKAQGYTLETLAELAGVHRTTIGLFERGERTPTVQVADQIARALGISLSAAIQQAEKHIAPVKNLAMSGIERVTQTVHFLNKTQLFDLTGLNMQVMMDAVDSCYNTLDLIDTQLLSKQVLPITQLVELANLSSMIGNLLGSGIAQFSNGLYVRNRPHQYPDLIPQQASGTEIEIKVALETNSPKGHLVKPGVYLTCRYVLGDRQGSYLRGKKARGDTVWIWEIKIGDLKETDFAFSSTEGDSGKTAVIKPASLQRMITIYYVPQLLPYAKPR